MSEQCSKTEPLSNEDRIELLALFQNTAEKIAYSKKQQWQLIILCSAFIGFLIGLRMSPNIFEIVPFKLVAALPLGMAVIVQFALNAYGGDIGRSRDRLDRIYGQLGSAFTRAYGCGKAAESDAGDRRWSVLGPIYIWSAAVVGSLFWTYVWLCPVV